MEWEDKHILTWISSALIFVLLTRRFKSSSERESLLDFAPIVCFGEFLNTLSSVWKKELSIFSTDDMSRLNEHYLCCSDNLSNLCSKQSLHFPALSSFSRDTVTATVLLSETSWALHSTCQPWVLCPERISAAFLLCNWETWPRHRSFGLRLSVQSKFIINKSLSRHHFCKVYCISYI